MSLSHRFLANSLTHLSRTVVAGGLSLSVLMGSGAIALTALLSTPQIAHAYTSRVTLLVPRDPAESYDTFLRLSEVIARAAIQRGFDADPLVSEVVVTIIGDNQGIAVPVMEVEVTRNEWQSRPDPQFWAEYYDTASVLLDL